MAVRAHQIDQALLAEFAKLVLRFGDPIAVGDEDFTGVHLYASLVVGHLVEQAANGPACLQTPRGAILADQNRGKMATVAIGQAMGTAIVDTQKQSRVFFGRSAFVELM